MKKCSITISYAAFQLHSIQMERPVNCRHDLKNSVSDPQRTKRVVWCHPLAMISVKRLGKAQLFRVGGPRMGARR